MTVLRITDDSTRADLCTAITNVNARAKRVPCVIGTEELPTEWDRRHAQINELLAEWERAES